jgi:hypothetical protein
MFRPSARVTDPHGREWEIYASKLALPRRGPPDPTPAGLGIPQGRGDLITAPIDGIVYLLAFIPRLLLLVFVDLPVALVRASRSDAWTIDAISWAPFRASYTWTTTLEHRGQVLAQIEGGLARGETPRPRNAQFVRSV